MGPVRNTLDSEVIFGLSAVQKPFTIDKFSQLPSSAALFYMKSHFRAKEAVDWTTQ